MKRILYSALIVFAISVVTGCNRESSSSENIDSGREYLSKKEWNSAIIEFKNAAKQEPKNAQARALLGTTYLEVYNVGAAIKELTKAIDYGYNKSELMVPLGLAYRQAGENKKIIE